MLAVYLALAIPSLVGAIAAEPPRKLDTGWVYRWGDSPVSPDGVLEWLTADLSASEWQPTGVLANPPGVSQEWLWLRLRLPEQGWPHPGLFIPRIARAFEVYVDTTLIYADGEFVAHRNKFYNVKTFLLSLPVDYQGRVLSLRVYSDGTRIGVTARDVPVAIGTEADLVGRILKLSLEHNIAGCIIFVVGLLVLIGNRLVAFRPDILFPLSLSVAALSIGTYFLTTRYAAVYLFNSPGTLYYIHFVSFLVFPIGLYAFVNLVMGRRSLVRYLWHASAMFAVVLIVLDLLDVASLSSNYDLANRWLLFTLAGMLVMIFVGVRQKRPEARRVLVAVAIAASAGLYDLLVKAGVLPFHRYISHWGLVAFAGALVMIVVRRYNRYTARLDRQSRELRAYADDLELKVAQRTQSLDARNLELQDALQRLEDTQQQLVLREKMASIGDLVAGVAHEVNTPIGAILSASNTSIRAIKIVQRYARDGCGSLSEEDSKRLNKALDALAVSSTVVLGGSERVAGIVRALKAFARLDEAEVQAVDIHECLESTLLLLEHRFKSGIEVVKDYGELPSICCVPSQLNQVFMNVLVNACDAVGDTGTIGITTGRAGGLAVIRISDSGPGIPPEHVDHIFDPGFTSKGVGVGTGMGLALSYRIMEKHGGEIHVDPQGGPGAIFEIRLPFNVGEIPAGYQS